MERALNSAPALRLKASLYPFTVLELETMDLAAIRDDLMRRLEQAPQLLKHAPVVIQLPEEPITVDKAQDLIMLVRELDLIPVGLRCLYEGGQMLADALKLPLLKESQSDKKQSQPNPPLLVKSPVRSGQQVVNSEGDIIVFGNVGQGAEVLAAGSIHIYGTLHGRALAGIRGDTQAHISCQKLQAELLAISGQYQISEDIDSSSWQQTAHISLQDGRLIIETD